MQAEAESFGIYPLPENVINAWGDPDFLDLMRQSLLSMDALFAPLQQAMAHGSYAHPEDAAFIELNRSEQGTQLEMDVGVFYQSSLPGCACAGDPDPQIPQQEYCVLRLRLNRAESMLELQLLPESEDVE